MDKAIDQNNFLYFISVITTQNVGRTLEELVSSCFFVPIQVSKCFESVMLS